MGISEAETSTEYHNYAARDRGFAI